jgi:hypothetical protein
VPRGGSKPGERRGGPKRGTPNRATAAKAAEIAAFGLVPLDYLLAVMRDENNPVPKDLQQAAEPSVHQETLAGRFVLKSCEVASGRGDGED